MYTVHNPYSKPPLAGRWRVERKMGSQEHPTWDAQPGLAYEKPILSLADHLKPPLWVVSGSGADYACSRDAG